MAGRTVPVTHFHEIQGVEAVHLLATTFNISYDVWSCVQNNNKTGE